MTRRPTPSGEEPVTEDLPPRLLLVAYLLAGVCAVVPLAVVGAIFAGVVVYNRGLREHGAGVIAVALISTAIGIVLLR